MNHTLLPLRPSTRNTRREEIRAHWSDDERRARAAVGRRRTLELADLLFDRDEPELWAVGAPACDDLARLAG